MLFATAAAALRLFLRKLEARGALAPDAREAVLALPAMPRRIEAHREIFRLDQPAEQVCLLAEGFAASQTQLSDGRRQLTAFHIPGDMMDLASLTLGAAPSQMVALAPCTLFQISHAALREAARRHPTLEAALGRESVISGLIAAEWLVNVGRRNAQGRIGHLLCEMATRFHQIGKLNVGNFPFPVTQEQLADALGLTSVHVNRSLKVLRGEGLIRITRSDATILDWRALAHLAEFEPRYLHLPPVPDMRERAAVA